MIRCLGSGRRVLGPDEQDGTVLCSVCGTGGLPMKTTTADGKKEFFVPVHERRAHPFRAQGKRRAAPPSRRGGQRNSGRH